MADKLSKAELHEMARERSRLIGVSPCPNVSQQLARIKENKKSGKLEHGAFEHLTVDFFDLTDIITDTGSRAMEAVNEKGTWGIVIQGTTKLGATLRVAVRLLANKDAPLLIADFQQVLES